MCNPSTPIGVLDETSPKIDTQCAFEGPKPIKHSLPSYPHKTPDLYLPNFVTLKIPNDFHLRPITNSYSYHEIAVV